MAKVTVPNCDTCGKVPEIMIMWVKSGDTEWTCLACHATLVLRMIAEQTEVPEAPDPTPLPA